MSEARDLTGPTHVTEAGDVYQQDADGQWQLVRKGPPGKKIRVTSATTGTGGDRGLDTDPSTGRIDPAKEPRPQAPGILPLQHTDPAGASVYGSTPGVRRITPRLVSYAQEIAAKNPEVEAAIAQKIATTSGLQHWAGTDPRTGHPWNPVLRAEFAQAGLPLSGPITPEQWRIAEPLILKRESAGGRNIRNFMFDAQHTAGGPHQITNQTWMAFGGPTPEGTSSFSSEHAEHGPYYKGFTPTVDPDAPEHAEHGPLYQPPPTEEAQAPIPAPQAVKPPPWYNPQPEPAEAPVAPLAQTAEAAPAAPTPAPAPTPTILQAGQYMPQPIVPPSQAAIAGGSAGAEPQIAEAPPSPAAGPAPAPPPPVGPAGPDGGGGSGTEEGASLPPGGLNDPSAGGDTAPAPPMPAGTMDRPPHNIFAGPGAAEVGEGQTAPPEAVAQPDEGQPEEEQDDLGAGAASAANAEMAQLVQPTSYTGDETPPEEPSPAAGGVEPAASGTIEVDPDQIKQVLRAQFGDTQVAQQMLEDAQRRRAQAQRDLDAASKGISDAQKRGDFDTSFWRQKRRDYLAAQEAYAHAYDEIFQNPPHRNTEDMAVSMGALTQALSIMGPASLLVPAWGAIGALGDSLIAQKQGNDAQYKQDWQHYKDLMGFAVNGLKLHATMFNEAIAGEKADINGVLFKLYPLTQQLEYDKMRENLDNHNFVAVSKQIENLNKLSKNLDANYKAHTEMVETEQYVQEGITKYRADHGLATDAPVPGREYLRLRGEAKELLSGKGAKPLSAAQKKEEQIKERGDIYYDEWATKNPDATDAQKRKAKSDAYLKAEQDFAAKVGASADPLSQKAIDEQAVTEYLADPANKDKPLTSDKMAELRRRVSVTQSRGGGTPTQMLLNTAINDWKRTADPSNPKNWSGGAVGIGEIFPPYDVLAKLANDAALAGKGESAWPEETMQMLAMGTIYGQPSQLSRLPRTGPARMQYENTLTKMMKERYGSLEQGYAYMAFNQERVMAAGAAAKAAGNITIRTETYRAELERAAQQVVDASARVPRTENPTVNAALNSWYRQTGNAEVIQLGLAINNLYQAYARMSNPTGTGVHDIDKQFLEGQINAGLSKNQVKGAVDQILREGQNLALAAWQGQVRVMQGLTPLPPDVQTPEAPEPGYLREQPPQYRPVDRDRVPEVPPNLPMGNTQWDRKLRQWVVDGKRYDEYGHAVGK